MNGRKLTTKISAGIFVFSCLALIAASLIYGEEGTRWVTVILVYPSLILLFGGIAFQDIKFLIMSVLKEERSLKRTMDLAIPLGRGGCFIALAILFINMEIGVVKSVL